MIELSELWIYPVKSLRGVCVTEAQVGPRGFVGDRRYMVVDAQSRFVTQREHPELARLKPTLGPRGVRIEGPSGEAVEVTDPEDGPVVSASIWGTAFPARDAGDDAAGFLAGFLGVPARLVWMPESTHRPADPEDARAGDRVAFQDGFPFLLTNEASLAVLAERLGSPVEMRRFRPNLVVRGAEAFAEDRWKSLRVGELTLHARKACPRCAVVDVDPERGVSERGVLSELARFRTVDRAARFGQNLVHDGTGRLRVGDVVTLLQA